MGSQPTNAAVVTEEDAVLAGLHRGLGRDGVPIPAYQTLGVEVRSDAQRSLIGPGEELIPLDLVRFLPRGPGVRSPGRGHRAGDAPRAAVRRGRGRGGRP